MSHFYGAGEMFKAIVTVLLTVVAGALSLLAFAVFSPSPDTASLNNDLATVKEHIRDARREDEQYSGGVIKALIQLRLNIMQHTEAMLEQKRAALLRRIWMHYTVDGRTISNASDSELSNILAELEQAEDKLQKSILNSQRYSGGLVHSMALLTVETDRMSVAQLRLKFYSAKHGTPLFGANASDAATPAPGKVVNDRQAF